MCNTKIGKMLFKIKYIYRKTHEQVMETTMKLHDVEQSLVNIEEENSFLRRKNEAFETELQKRKDYCEELEAKISNLLEEQEKKAKEDEAKQFIVEPVQSPPKVEKDSDEGIFELNNENQYFSS